VAHEGRAAVHVGVERYAAKVGVLDGAQRLDGAYTSHGGLAAVDDGET
jgi:hypothetical protein